jgi:hypothetical protein
MAQSNFNNQISDIKNKPENSLRLKNLKLTQPTCATGLSNQTAVREKECEIARLREALC